MSSIVLIASGESIARCGAQLQEQLPPSHSLSIVTACMEEAVDYARHRLPKETDVVIARGNTASMLKNARLSVPVVTIPIRDSELIRSIELARALYGEEDARIAYIGLEDTIRSVKSFLELLHRNIRLYPANSSQDIQKSVRLAKKEQVSVVIGGIFTRQEAEKNGLKSVLLESSPASVREAYERALEVQKGVKLQKKKLQERITMMNAISEGMIGISEKEKLTFLNPAAETIFHVSAASLIGKNASVLFGEEERAVISRLLLHGSEITGHPAEICGVCYTMDFYPVLIRKKNKGIIISIRKVQETLQDPGLKKASEMEPAHLPHLCEASHPVFFHQLVGEHPAFLAAKSMAVSCSASPLPVLLIGEDGTGKTALARCIHQESPRRDALFLVRDATQLTVEDLLSAHKGTLYIRNPESLSSDMCVVLTGLLENGTVPLPDHTRCTPDVRILAGSSVNLSHVLPPRLYYGLNAFLIPVPALRQRSSDIPLLLSHFWEESCRKLSVGNLPANAAPLAASVPFPGGSDQNKQLVSYSWPGNIRQLQNFCRRTAFFHISGTNIGFSLLSPDDDGFYSHLSQEAALNPAASVSASVCPAALHPASPAKGFLINRKLVTYEELRSLDRLCQGRKSVLAEKLGISRSTLWRYFRKMEEDNI